MDQVKAIILVLSLALIGKSFATHKECEFVDELTAENFHNSIEDNKYVLVNFYSPNCGHCKALAPEYFKAAEQLSADGSDIKLAMVDATKEVKLANEYKVGGYPTMKFFVDGKQMEYRGGRKAEQIVSWVVHKSGPAATVITSVEDVNKLIESNAVVAVGFIADVNGDLMKAFMETAREKDDIPFALVQDQSLFAAFNVTGDNIVIFKDFDEKKAEYGGSADFTEITEFVHINSIPLVVDFTYDFAPTIFGGNIKNHLLIFTSTKAENYDDLKDMFTRLAKKYKGKLLFIVVDSDKEELKTISHFFGVAENELPGIRIVSLGEDMQKFKSSENDLNEESIQLFINQFFAGELKPDLLSEEIPEDWDHGLVKKLVGKNFNKVVEDNGKNVLVMFYAPWCGHCKKLEPLWDELGEHFKDSSETIIAKIDSTKNEVEKFKIRAFPTIKLFTKGKEKVKDYSGERTKEGILKFVESGGMDGGAVDVDDDNYEYNDESSGHDEL